MRTPSSEVFQLSSNMAESKGVLARGEHQERTTSITSISAEEAPAFDHAMNNNVEAKYRRLFPSTTCRH